MARAKQVEIKHKLDGVREMENLKKAQVEGKLSEMNNKVESALERKERERKEKMELQNQRKIAIQFKL